jgi:hypothetical protein
MSNNFTNSDIDDLLSSVKTENHQLPQWLNIVDNNSDENTSEFNNTLINNMAADSATSDVFVNDGTDLSGKSVDSATSDVPVQKGGFLSATSSDINDIFIGQLGGNTNLKVSASPDDINNLIDMLTSEKVNENFDTVTSITNTEVLETQLRELLNQAKDGQEGGAKKKKASKSSKKASKSSKKASKSSKKSKKASKKASKKSSKKAKGSKKYKNEEPVAETAPAPAPAPAPEKKKRAPNPALLAFGALSKHVAEKLGISNGPKAKKVAGAANREMKEKHPELSAVEIAKKAEEHFNNNIDRFRKIIEE